MRRRNELTAPRQRRLDVTYDSEFFGRFAETGLAGGLTLIALWIAIGVAVDRLVVSHPDSWIAIAAAAGIIGTLVNTMNADVMNFRFLWVALGLVRGLQDPLNVDGPYRQPTSTAPNASVPL